MKKFIVIILLILTGCVQKKEMYKYSYQKVENEIKNIEQKVTPATQTFENSVRNESLNSDIVEISEKMFITHINDIYYNFNDYENKTIIVEGMFTYLSGLNGNKAPAVYRNGPGCCGNDGWGGFLLEYNGEFPLENDWIKVSGKPKLVINGNYRDLFLVVESIEVKEERGAEYVEQ